MNINETASHIIGPHWERIASDLGECHVADLVNHYIQDIRWGEGIEEVEEIIENREEIIDAVKALNFGHDYVKP